MGGGRELPVRLNCLFCPPSLSSFRQDMQDAVRAEISDEDAVCGTATRGRGEMPHDVRPGAATASARPAWAGPAKPAARHGCRLPKSFSALDQRGGATNVRPAGGQCYARKGIAQCKCPHHILLPSRLSFFPVQLECCKLLWRGSGSIVGASASCPGGQCSRLSRALKVEFVKPAPSGFHALGQIDGTWQSQSHRPFERDPDFELQQQSRRGR